MARRSGGRGGGGRTSSGRGAWLLAALLLAVSALVLVLALLGRDRGPGETPAAPADFGQRLRALAERRGAGPRDVLADDPIRKVDRVFVRSWRVTLPDRAAAAGLAADLEAEAAAWSAVFAALAPPPPAVARCRVDLGVEAFDVELRVAVRVAERVEPTAPARPSPTPRPSPRPGSRGRLAILLDDAGQDLALVPAVVALPRAVAVAVLPFLPHSSAVAGEVHRAGHEVWLHLPMEAEPGREEDAGPGAVLVAMSESEIRDTVHSALNSVPHAVGVNNHMGSRATADLRTMTWVMQELSARGMAFVDSRTTAATVAEDAARAQGVKTGRRHVFLDNDRSRPAIRRSLAEAVQRCRTEGPVIAIGHLTAVTVEVLEEELPGLAGRGADLVPPSALVR